LKGIQGGFWKLENFEEPTRKNQMDSFTFMKTLVPKRIIKTVDLRKLTVYETNRLLQKYNFTDQAKKKKKTRFRVH